MQYYSVQYFGMLFGGHHLGPFPSNTYTVVASMVEYLILFGHYSLILIEGIFMTTTKDPASIRHVIGQQLACDPGN